MRIYSMTATFGKLEHQTLTLRPGLNVIEAPNEWGKSTWCAFLVAMFYGIATRERTTQDTLADKERYAPWSGNPMSGRIDLNWNGRDITIERSTKGRSIFGIFRAYETDTGLPIPELTAVNCGEVLLGVEKSVFTRAGFVKLTDLPVTEDNALWRRLNALVTTGDESGSSDTLAQKLKDLKNQCMSNRANGLIPQALNQKKELEDTLSQLQDLQLRHQQLTHRLEQLQQRHRELSNHQAALDYESAQTNAQRIYKAQQAQAQAESELTRLQTVCADYPERWVLEKQQHNLKALQQESSALQLEMQMLPPMPQAPEPYAPFRDMTPAQAAAHTEKDAQAYAKAKADKLPILLSIFGILALVIALVGLFLDMPIALLCLLPGVLCLVLAITRSSKNKALAAGLESHYGSPDPQVWKRFAADFTRRHDEHYLRMQRWNTNREAYRQRQEELSEKIRNCIGNVGLQETLERLQQSLRDLDSLEVARREMLRAENHATALQELAKPMPKPEFPDTLTYTKEETAHLLADCAYEQRQLIDTLGRCKGQMETLGQEDALIRQRDAVNDRLEKLKMTYSALELAQRTLTEASAQLQRRFAPRISQRAQKIMGKLTAGRYDRLILGEDFSLCAGAQNEDILHESRWRSDGTVDQLYLALRLAVAEELTPHAPLVLDDALVRFDDTRLAAAMDILKAQAQSKQILLFTCQGRENHLLESP